MKIKRVTYLALGAFVSVASCTKEAAGPDVYDWAEGEIYFKTSLADVSTSRAQDMTLDRLESFQVTCFNSADSKEDPTRYNYPYFENATFIRKAGSGIGTYESSPAEGPREWPANSGLLRFFAYSPSLSVMTDGNSGIPDADRSKYFELINNTTKEADKLSIDYRLCNVRINPDIARQYDFVTAAATGERWKDFGSGVELAFSHKLSQVELRAWGASSEYDFEIAGVRIGNPVVEGTFIFADDANPDLHGVWDTSIEGVKDKVEYLFQSSADSHIEGVPAAGDRIFKIHSSEHSAVESAASIMGNGGCAMVIPTENTKWEGINDPNIGTTPYKTDRMYFSILLRAREKASGKVIYPYPGNPYGMKVIYYAVDKSGTIISRLYPGEEGGIFFTDPDLQNPFEASEEVEIMDFGWAAVPVDADWKAGKKYIYTLDYSEGIGVHDPEDPEPGRPIAGESSISWGVKVSNWDYAQENDDYTPDLEVP
ncbi:MAG: fimbrillin family protein [Muribaculaceae bacterium]|nr:fimbrillin family protein [Muribaculaceae bacterium]MDE6552004.1 fimbrillin family protein [Muribaculaceae bacterium]